MRGIVTRHATELTWSAFDRGFYELKQPSGRITEPTSDGINMISCWGDTDATRSDPSLAARTADGTPALPDHADHDRGYVCPTHEGYRERLFGLIDEAIEQSGDLRLDDVGFPAEGYCDCERCHNAFAESNATTRDQWRADVVTDFVAAVAGRVPGELIVGVYPDPYPGHLVSRCGIDLDALATYVDEFVVPLYDTTYATTYWVEIIAGGFSDRCPTPLGVELYAADVPLDALRTASQAADRRVDHVYYGYDAGTARALVRRERAAANPGREFG